MTATKFLAARIRPRLVQRRLASSATSQRPPPSSTTTTRETTKPTSLPPTTPPSRPESWLTRKVKSSPAAKHVFLSLASFLGYTSPRQISARRALDLYTDLCVPRAQEDRAFWLQTCDLPPTFQSWFTITNFYVWLLTVRLRALPAPHGTYYVQGLIDHFFLDLEARMRFSLQPGLVSNQGPPPGAGFYMPDVLARTAHLVNPKSKSQTHTQTQVQAQASEGESAQRKRAPERLLTQQMKIFREQWAGVGLSLDHGLATTDAELAAAVWRNFLGARGANGITFPSTTTTSPQLGLSPSPAQAASAPNKNDGSGVNDYPPGQADRYVAYPEIMLTFVEYIRRETLRLAEVSDVTIMGSGIGGGRVSGGLRFGRIKL